MALFWQLERYFAAIGRLYNCQALFIALKIDKGTQDGDGTSMI